MKSNTSSKGECSLDKLFISQLADMHSAEKMLSKALILIAKAARSEDLKELLELHQQETKGHGDAIEQIADSLGIELPRKTCYAMKGLIEEGVIGMLKNIKSSVLDTALIAIGCKIEHYEIASYGTLCRWAEELGYARELALLVSILNQEKLANTLLGELAEGAGPLPEVVRRVSLEQMSPAGVG